MSRSDARYVTGGPTADTGLVGMPSVRLGASGPAVPIQGFGAMSLADPPTSGDDPLAVIHRALDLGATFIDTAEMYGRGANEELVGRALRTRREEAVLATKFGVLPGPGKSWTARGDAATAKESCEASLRRLGADVIDVFYLHRRDPHVPIEESVGAMAELVQEGKVLHLGLSEVTAAELQAAHSVHPIAALQSEWSLTRRKVEEVLPTCIELGVAVVPYSPQRRLLAAGSSPLDKAVAAIARRHGVSRGQVALAWVQQQADVWGVTVVPIPGTTRVAHLEENVGALIVRLSAAKLKELSLLDY